MENQKDTFRYTYSASQQEEVSAIRKKYITPEEKEDKLALVRRMDEKVTEKAELAALVVGILGALILGFGMSLVMTDLAAMMGLGSVMAMLLGIVTGAAGLVMVIVAYPLYNRVIRKERAKIAPEIIRLTDDLLD